MKTPEIRTDHLTLVPWREEFSQKAFYNWFSDEASAKYMCWDVHGDVSDTENWVKREIRLNSLASHYSWAVLTDNGDVAGCVQLLYSSTNKCFEISYVTSRFSRGQGITDEYVAAVSDFAFSTLHVDEITARCAASNRASEKVLIKNGFTETGKTVCTKFSGKSFFEAKIYKKIKPSR